MAAPSHNYSTFPQPSGQPPQGYPNASQPPYPTPITPIANDAPSAPPVAFDQIGGYENTTGVNSVMVGPPPVYNEPDQPTAAPKETFASSAFVSDEDAKMALVEFASSACCYGNGPAKDMKIKDMVSSSAYHYSLDTFNESRQTNWHYEPFRGQNIDGPMFGYPPGPWDIFVEPPTMFVDKLSHIEVPHTASVRGCSECHERGKVKCNPCHGHGHQRCTFCNGEGYRVKFESEREECSTCNGRGEKDCIHCHGHGHVKCKKCEGCGQVKAYIRLTVTWKTQKGSHVLERSALPDHLVEDVQGDEVFAQQFPRVFPLTSFPESEINQASHRLINDHLDQLKFSRILMQRHNLRAVPVTEVIGEWKDKRYHYWVFGKELKVYFPDYPQKCCCGCVIL